MSYAATLVSLAAVHLAANVSPGPNLILVTQVAAAQSRAAGLRAAMGLTTGAAIWAMAAVLGLGLLTTIGWLQGVLRLLGGAYLIYLGLRLCVAASPPDGARSMPPGRWRPFRLGVATNLANPMSLVFFGGIFAALLPADSPIWLRLSAVLVIVVDALVWYVLLALAFSAPRAQRVYGRARVWIDRVLGGALAFFGLRLILSDR